MAISYVGSADLGNNGGTTNNLVVSYSVTAGSTLLRICFLGDLTTGSDDITIVRYAGVDATPEFKSILGTGSSGNRFKYSYAIYNPATGSNSVQIFSTNVHYLLGGVAEYSGAVAFDATGEGTAITGSTTLTASVTTIADNCWAGAFLEAFDNVDAPTAGAGMTMRVTDVAFKSWGIGDSNGPKHPAGAYSMTGTLNGGSSTRPMVLDLVSFSQLSPIPYRKFNQAYLRR